MLAAQNRVVGAAVRVESARATFRELRLPARRPVRQAASGVNRRRHLASAVLAGVYTNGHGAERSAPAAAAATSGASVSPWAADLLVTCPDQKGVVAALAQVLFTQGCNIVTADQFTDLQEGVFYQRLHVDFQGPEKASVLESALKHTIDTFGMDAQLHYRWQRKRVLILVSKLPHCLYDLLLRNQAGELECEVVGVVSNHADLAFVAQQFNIPFHHLPMETERLGKEAAKAAQEEAMEALIASERVDLIVLARYMQVLSHGFCERHWRHMINIHHSFLPAFEGAKPYHRAYERGVKIIGATAHYATAELDCGPIIQQDVDRISHRDSVATMLRKGKDLERMVLAKAVTAHLTNRVIVRGNKTVVFDE